MRLLEIVGERFFNRLQLRIGLRTFLKRYVRCAIDLTEKYCGATMVKWGEMILNVLGMTLYCALFTIFLYHGIQQVRILEYMNVVSTVIFSKHTHQLGMSIWPASRPVTKSYAIHLSKHPEGDLQTMLKRCSECTCTRIRCIMKRWWIVITDLSPWMHPYLFSLQRFSCIKNERVEKWYMEKKNSLFL